MSDYYYDYYEELPDETDCNRVRVSIANGLRFVRTTDAQGAFSFGCDPEEFFAESAECGEMGREFCQPIKCGGVSPIQVYMENDSETEGFSREPIIHIVDRTTGEIVNRVFAFKTFDGFYDFDVIWPSGCDACLELTINSYVISENVVENGNFDDGDGWEDVPPLDFTFSITNESHDQECDGAISVSPFGGTAPYFYSINGVDNANENFNNLCVGTYNICVKDVNGVEVCKEITIFKNADCSQFSGMTLDQVIATGVTLQEVYNCTLEDFKP